MADKKKQAKGQEGAALLEEPDLEPARPEAQEAAMEAAVDAALEAQKAAQEADRDAAIRAGLDAAHDARLAEAAQKAAQEAAGVKAQGGKTRLVCEGLEEGALLVVSGEETVKAGPGGEIEVRAGEAARLLSLPGYREA